jgi:hypothetical protein
MGKQYNKVIKKKRRVALKKRRKAKVNVSRKKK